MAQIKEEDLRLNIILNGDKTRKELSQLSQQIKDQTAKIAGLTNERKKAVNQYGKESAEVKKLDVELKREKNSLDALKKKYADHQSQLKLTEMTINELSKRYRQLKIALNNTAPNTPEWKRLNAELQKTKARMDQLNSSSKQSHTAIAGIAAKFVAVIAVVRTVGRLLSGFVSKIAEFEQANVNLATVLGKPVAQIQELTDDALKLGRATEYTASQVSSLQMEFAKLGFSKSEILNMTEPTLNFATAVGTDLASAAKLAGATLRIFGLSSRDTEDTLSVLAVSTNKSALSFSYLDSAMSTVGPVANAFGFSVRDTTALLGTLANAGFDASSAATATRNILLNLADGSGKLAKALGGPVKTFPELMEGLQTLRDKGVDLNATLELTDKRSVAAFNSFLDGADSAIVLRNSLDDVDGELKRIAEERINTVEGSFKILKSAWEGFVLSLSNSKGVIKNVLDTVAAGITNVTNAINAQEQSLKIRGENYMKSLLRLYGGDVNQVRTALNEEAQNTADEVRDLQTRVDNALFLEAGNRAQKKRLAEQQELMTVQSYALEAFDAYLKYGENGAPEKTDTPTNTTTTPTTPRSGSSKKAWSLKDDEGYLIAKNALTQKYLDGEIATEDAYNEALYQLEVAIYTSRISLGKENGAELLKIQEELQSKMLSHKKEADKKSEEAEKNKNEMEKASAEFLDSLKTEKEEKAIAAEKKRYQAELESFEKYKSAIEDQNKVKETIERNHQNNILKIQLEAFDERQKELEKQFKLQKLKIQNVYADSNLAVPKGSASETSNNRKKDLEVAEAEMAYLQSFLDSLTEELEKKKDSMNADQILDWEIKIEETKNKLLTLQDSIKGTKMGLFQGTGGSLFGVTDVQWRQFFDRMKAGTLQAEDMINLFTAIGEAAKTGFDIAQKAINLTNAKENEAHKEWQKENDKKKQDLQARYDSGLLGKAQYDSELAALEAEADSRSEELQLKQAKRAKSLSLAQAIIETALSTMKTFTNSGGWPWGIIPAAIMAAIGAANIAMIAATPVTTGAEEGGEIMVQRSQDGKQFKARLDPDRRGFIDRPTALVGENGPEYVIPAEGVRNPSMAPILKTIEAARQKGTLRNINLSAAYPAAGFASGGLTSGRLAPDEGRSAGVDPEFTALLKKLDKRLSEPIKTYTTMLGKDGLVEQMNRYERNRKNGEIG